MLGLAVAINFSLSTDITTCARTIFTLNCYITAILTYHFVFQHCTLSFYLFHKIPTYFANVSFTYSRVKVGWRSSPARPVDRCSHSTAQRRRTGPEESAGPANGSWEGHLDQEELAIHWPREGHATPYPIPDRGQAAGLPVEHRVDRHWWGKARREEVFCRLVGTVCFVSHASSAELYLCELK